MCKKCLTLISIFLLVGLAAGISNAERIPIPAGFPNDNTTGIKGAGLTEANLTSSGSITVTTNGAVVELKNVSGSIKISASNVTVRKCKVTGGIYGIDCTGQYPGALIEDCTILNSSSKGVCGGNMTVKRCNIYGSVDGIYHYGNVTIEDCWIHDLYDTGTSHNDGIQCQGGSHLVLRHNSIQPEWNMTSAILYQTNYGYVDDVDIDNNFLSGGGYTLRLSDKGTGYGAPTNVTVHYNVFEEDYYIYGHLTYDGSPTFLCNVWDDGSPTPENPSCGSNQSPVADAGSDQQVTDTDDNGSELISLDGGDSYDPDGSITSYVWKEGTTQIATGVSPDVTLNVGSHTITLTVTDDDSATDTDNVVINVSPAADTTAPSPNPMTWNTVPYASSGISITMTATTATDASGVEYYFDETTGNPGGSDSGWQDSVTYVDAGLSTSTQYTYRVKARDKSSNQNETDYSTTKSATTEAQTQPLLTGWWKLDETSGTTAADSSGNSYDGTVTGASWTSSGYIDGGISFNGTSGQRVEVPTSAMSVSAGTISLWGKVSSATNVRYFFGHTSSSTSWADRIQLYMSNGDSQLDLGLGGSHTTATNIAALSTGTWYHIALTWHNGDYSVYVDGVSKASGTYTGLSTLGSVADIGNNGSSSDRTEPFNGVIDDVRIYDKALDADEVNAIYEGVVEVASSPNPADEATNVATTAVLSWTPGEYAASHDVYLGTSYNSVADANYSSSEYKGNFDTNSFDPNGLGSSTTYYWAVDEVNDTSLWLGDIWSFTTEAAPDTTAPTPDPMTWATEPYATGTSSISMTATTATDASGVEYYFECTAGGGHSSSWQDSATYEDTGLSESTQYTYRVKARDKSANQNETAYSTTRSATTQDGTAPTPNPMTWATEPYATGTSSISMTATTATDASGVEYFFDCTTAGGHDSSWQDSTTYEDTGLSPSTQYSYQVKARDKSSNQNETAYSTLKSATTQSVPDTTPPSPDPMTWATEPYATGTSSISMTATTATDVSGVEYYFECTAGGGHSSSWQDSTSYTDTGLSPSTQYSYRVKARDKSASLNETAYSTVKSATTQAPPDTTPPSPNPMTWATEPYATGTSSISMTATTATDVSGVEYFFDCTTAGGHDSSWQDSITYQDTGLSAGTQYTYHVKARDKSSNQNETAYSTTKSATTDTTGGQSLEFTASEDTYVNEQAPSLNDGSATTLRVRTNTDKSYYSYIKVTVSGANGTVTSAKLKIRVYDESIPYNVSAWAVTGSWSESTLTWNNDDLVWGSSALDTKSGLSAETWYEWDVTSAVSGNGTYTFGVKMSATSSRRLYSTESAYDPVLLVETNGGE